MRKESLPPAKMKIALVSDAIYPYNKGGKEKRIYEISTRLAKAGHEVHIYTMKWWKDTSKTKLEKGVYLHAICKLYPLYQGRRRSITQAFFFSLACLKLLREDFDIIDVDHMPHLVLFSTKIVSLFKRKRLFVTWNEVWGRSYWKEYLGRLGSIAYLIEWITAHFPDSIIAVSEHTKQKLISNLTIKTPISVVPNGIALAEINTVQPAKQKSDIIYAGRLLSHKNIDVLIKSIELVKKSYSNITCFIVGNGPEKYRLKKMVTDLHLGKNVIFYDFLPEDTALYGLMKASKVFVFPSTREGFGIVAIEALASGIPVITTNHKDNATKSLITNTENGEAIPLSEKRFADSIQRYLKRKNPKKNHDDVIKQYDWDNIAKKIEAIYRSAL